MRNHNMHPNIYKIGHRKPVKPRNARVWTKQIRIRDNPTNEVGANSMIAHR